MDNAAITSIPTDLVTITPSSVIDLNDKKYRKLELSSLQQARVNQLVSQLPAAHASSTIANAWIMKWPEDLTGSLMQYHKGGVGTAVIDNGKIAGHVSLFQLDQEAIILGAFSAMSVATGQFFLTQINNQLSRINQSIDSILGFLYGDKRSELLAEASFVQYAYRNYQSIMEHNEQRVATISSLQNARLVAMKDIEFYMDDLQQCASDTPKKFQQFSISVQKAMQTRECLELAIQLYALSYMMESSFSRNTDSQYLDAVKGDVISYVNKCENRILQSFSGLRKQLDNYKSTALDKFDAEPLRTMLDEIIISRSDGKDSPLRSTIESVIAETSKPHLYVIEKNGNVYLADA